MAATATADVSTLTATSTTIHGRNGFGAGGSGIDQSVRYPFDEIGSDVSTLLGPVVVLAAIVGTLWIALSQPDQTALDQTATTKRSSRRAPDPERGPSADKSPERSVRPRGRPSPAMMTPAVPAGFHWMDAVPAPKFRAGFALVVILGVLGALLAVAVAGVVVGAAAAVT
jgi:hypothetical protein